ncbi:MAG: tRNA (5-methylaminomethyl-2-thiouridine)(34)-methyltransferase MnmD [Alphaproteobacteria bacterium]
MKREILLTDDGSYTVSIPEMNVTYHSMHGALQESVHIYIVSGLYYALPNVVAETISVFEMGFGTGLNALLTLQEAIRLKRKIYYYTVELFPLLIEEAKALQQDVLLNSGNAAMQLHEAEWEKEVIINEYFTVHKTKQSLLNLTLPTQFDVIYFDAFAPTDQPDLWTEAVFANLYHHLNTNGVLVTYSCKGTVRRALQAVGFKVEKIPGPVGKAEIVRAVNK